MKCVKKGNQHQQIYTATCLKCGSEFEARKDELKFVFCRNEESLQTETCTECGAYGLTFKPKAPPSTMRNSTAEQIEAGGSGQPYN